MSVSKVSVLSLGFGLWLPLAITASISSYAAVPVATYSAAPAMKTGSMVMVTKADNDDDSAKTSDADKRAKAIECSKQADAKKLHGEARKKFRSTCKRG